MHRPLLVTALLALPVSTLVAQEDLDRLLRFEGPRTEAGFTGWGGGPTGTMFPDTIVVHGGRAAARLERSASSSGEFTSLTRRLPLEIAGRWIELRGFLRTEGVTGFAGLWMRQDGPTGPVQFDNMQARDLKGTTEWTQYTIRLPLDSTAQAVFVGVLMAGEGKVWADDLELLVDGAPFTAAQKRERVETVVDTDREFATGSGITLATLTPSQVDHLALLGRIWGFLKYHHPRVTAGELHWDFELFRVLPRILAARNDAVVRRSLVEWIDQLGVPERCDPCAAEPANTYLTPALDWTRDDALLGVELSQRLQAIHRHRHAGDAQFYVAQTPGVGNPVFAHELAYADQRPPDAGGRILALFRFWNIIEYWFPYRDLLDDDWLAVLREALPRIVAAADWDAYRLELLTLIARVKDTHANLWSDLDVRPPRGDCVLPIRLRFVEDRLTVTEFPDSANVPGDLTVGDVIRAIDGHPVDSLVEAWLPYYAASNRTTQLRDMARAFPRGVCGDARLELNRRGVARHVTVARVAPGAGGRVTQDRPGPAFQLLSPEVAYLKLSAIRVQDVPGHIDRAAGTHGLIIDIRNYPSEFVVFALGTRLVREPTPFARFTIGSLENPGAFTWTDPLTLGPQPPNYAGKVVILVDETSISSAEYTAMAFRASPGAIVVGSTTAGADGNVSQILLPGGLRTMISGIGVFYPDKRPTQRVGIVPDVVVTPTLAGIREGRDEVLEEALRRILGPGADEVTIRKLATSPR